MPCTHPGCRARRAYGFQLVTHVEPCTFAPVGACTDCGHDIVPGQDHEHEMCAAA